METSRSHQQFGRVGRGPQGIAGHRRQRPRIVDAQLPYSQSVRLAFRGDLVARINHFFVVVQPPHLTSDNVSA